MIGGAFIIALVGCIYCLCKYSSDKSKSKAFDKSAEDERDNREKRMKEFESKVVDTALEDYFGCVARGIRSQKYKHYYDELVSTQHIYAMDVNVLNFQIWEDIQRILLANRGRLKHMDAEFGLTINSEHCTAQTLRESRCAYAAFISGINKQLVKNGVIEKMYLVGECPHRVQPWDGGTLNEPYGTPLWDKVQWAPSLYDSDFKIASQSNNGVL